MVHIIKKNKEKSCLNLIDEYFFSKLIDKHQGGNGDQKHNFFIRD